jgi:hypothetical protein
VKAGLLSQQVQIETCTWDVPPENVVDDLVNEVKAQLHQAEAPEWTEDWLGAARRWRPHQRFCTSHHRDW